MAESRIVGVRVPDYLYEVIEERVRTTGRSKSQVVLSLIKKGLGVKGPGVNAVNYTVNVEELVKK